MEKSKRKREKIDKYLNFDRELKKYRQYEAILTIAVLKSARIPKRDFLYLRLK